MARLTEELSEPEYLQYGSNRGRPGLLIEVANWLNACESEAAPEPFTAESVFISNGSQQALYLAMQSLCDVGGVILVQQPTYFVFLELCRGLGIEAVSLPVLPDGGHGLRGAAGVSAQAQNRPWRRPRQGLLPQQLLRQPVLTQRTCGGKACPRRALLDNGLYIPVIEDAAYRELWFEEPYPAPSVYSLPSTTRFRACTWGLLPSPLPPA